MKKVIIITGASRGIGRNMAYNLALEGNKIIANYNKSEKEILDLKNKLKEKNIEIDIFKADVSKKEEVDSLVDFAIEKYNKIDVLINNAGISQIKPFLDIEENEWDNMININLKSVYNTSKAVLPNMLKYKEGLIINISSIWGIIGASCEVHYSTAKAGIIGFTKALAKEMGPSNIRVNGVAPGIIKTDMNKELDDEEIKQIVDDIPLEKIGKPEYIEKCIEWLIEDEYTTGQVISINGGWVII